MAANNFDKKIKKHLEEREIKPSARTWDQLAAALEAKEEKSNKKYWWLAIAASFLAGILLTSLVFNQQSTPAIQLVEESTAPKEQIYEEVEVVQNNKTEASLKDNYTQKQTGLAETKSKIALKIEQENALRAVNSVIEQQEINRVKLQRLSLNNLAALQQKLVVKRDFNLEEDVIDKPLASTKILSSAEEAELLLAQAKQNVKLRNIKNPYPLVNAEDLLEHIEVENKQTFKEKILYALESGLKQVKNSVIK
ncbi:hypothetical protein [Mesonia aestuariivivens]|uniref:Anti-sigma factor n=1 Tax=Mesonia aestuariivivens TaxID=2796128 RepID=A0ABS6W466_9FLAO|nr:hypothetical protein [Mesonia aestuariivivens]MBW2962650.1 hypothetical protein [Mesonia aestuariivivens]